MDLHVRCRRWSEHIGSGALMTVTIMGREDVGLCARGTSAAGSVSGVEGSGGGRC